jgi:hypothetical protein
VTQLDLVVLVLALLGPVLALAGLARLPATLVLFTLGLLSAMLPGLPGLRIPPEWLTSICLPPLLYAATVRVTWHLLRFTLLRGVLAGILLSAASVVAAAALARLLLPELGWPAAIGIGIVAALADTRLFHEAKGRPHVPRAVADLLKAREMVGRLVALTAFGLTMATLERGEAPGLPEAAAQTAWQWAGGAAAGLGLGWAVVRLRARAEPAPVEIAVSIATPLPRGLRSAAARHLRRHGRLGRRARRRGSEGEPGDGRLRHLGGRDAHLRHGVLGGGEPVPLLDPVLPGRPRPAGGGGRARPVAAGADGGRGRRDPGAGAGHGVPGEPRHHADARAARGLGRG